MPEPWTCPGPADETEMVTVPKYQLEALFRVVEETQEIVRRLWKLTT